MPEIRVSTYTGEKWLEVPLPSPMLDGVVYHYTSAAGLIGIIESGRFWASSPVALNDLSELEHGISVFESVWASIKATGRPSANDIDTIERHLSAELLRESLSHVYLVCASLEADSLNQWQYYTAPPGYAVGIQTSGNLAVVVPTGEADTLPWANISTNIDAGWYKVLYEPADQERVVRAMLEWIIDNGGHLLRHPEELVRWVAPLIPQLKHPSFSAEREVRFVASKLPDIPDAFRAGAYGITPYITVAPSQRRQSFVVDGESGSLPIVSLACGPVNEAEHTLVRAAAQRLLSQHGYGGAPVTNSRVPYRVR